MQARIIFGGHRTRGCGVQRIEYVLADIDRVAVLLAGEADFGVENTIDVRATDQMCVLVWVKQVQETIAQ